MARVAGLRLGNDNKKFNRAFENDNDSETQQINYEPKPKGFRIDVLKTPTKKDKPTNEDNSIS